MDPESDSQDLDAASHHTVAYKFRKCTEVIPTSFSGDLAIVRVPDNRLTGVVGVAVQLRNLCIMLGEDISGWLRGWIVYNVGR